MIVNCQKCESSFNMNDSLIKETGSKVKCSKCENVFVVYPSTLSDEADLDTGLDDFEEEFEALPSLQDEDGDADDLDLPELDDIFGEDGDEGLDDLSGDVAEELDLDFGDDADAEEEFTDIEDSADPDLPDLEDIMDFDSDGDEDIELEAADSSDDFELDLDNDFNVDPGGEIDELSPETDEDEHDLLDAGNLLDDDELLLDGEDDEQISDDLELDLDMEDAAAADDELDPGDLAADDDELELGDLSLDDDELSLDLESSEDISEPSGDIDSEQMDTLDLSDLEDLIDSDEPSASALSDDVEDEDIDLSLEIEEESSELSAPALSSDEEDEDIDLSLEIEEESSEPSASALSADAEDMDIDLSIDFEEEASEPSAEYETVEDLDLSDLDLDIDGDVDLTPSDEIAAVDDELDLDLDFDTESAAAETADSTESVEDLDLLDLEEMIDSDDAPAAVAETEAADTDLVQDIELDAESVEPVAVADEAGELDFSDLEEIIENDDTPAAGQPAADSSEDQELELDLDFDADAEAPPAAADEVADSANELDFSDLGEMLGDDEEPTIESATDDVVQELDLDLDLETDTAAEAQSGSDTVQMGDSEEFLDIEKMLEETEEAAVETESAGDADDLNFDSDIAEQDTINISTPVEDDLELDLLESDEAALQEEVVELGSSDLQEVSAGTDGLSDTTDDFAADEFTDTQDLNGETEIIDGLSDPPAMPKPKRGARKLLTVFALFLILLAGVLILPQNFGLKIPFLSDIEVPYITDIKIPYISDKFNPDAKDTVGNLRIIPLERTIKYQFVENDNTGMLFVIQGRLKNDYNHPRKHIRITGKLFLKGNKLAKKATVFGGNLLTDKELANMNIKAIKKKLQNKAGNRKSNLNVRAGSILPFMVVFDKLPQNLDEYTIEVAGSSS